ncbi:MAG: 5-methyltetrahydrofolate--homocysteine methyltransferase [Cellvibrionaceae bacterium]|jgi:5-methyltetrahydrofolate--homocysteine methyltransferase
MNDSVNDKLKKILSDRIMVLDGAMGTMIQRHTLTEEDFRGDRFKNHLKPLKGNNDLLSIIRPDIIKSIHSAYFEAGADFATTNSFNATSIAQADYGMEAAVYDINYAAAQCARQAADEWASKKSGKNYFVLGALGPTNRTASMSPDVNDPGKRLVTFETLRVAYREAASALLDGGADLLMIETVFDSLNAKAALFAIDELREDRGEIPIMMSGTITDASGRTLSGQTPEAFWVSIAHGDLLSVGLNCALGASDMLPYIQRLDKIVNVMVSAHPNAGLPNEFGEYDQTPELMVEQLRPFVEGSHLNIIGGCCGTTPEHIAAIKALADTSNPRR